MNHTNATIQCVTLWCGVGLSDLLQKLGIASWSDASAMIVFFYTFLLIFWFFWKSFWKPLLVSLGYIKKVSVKRPVTDFGDLT